MCFKQILMLFMCFSLKIEFLCVLTEHFFYIFFLCGKRAFLCGESAYPFYITDWKKKRIRRRGLERIKLNYN
jgi:hypothetical protein